MILKSKNWDIGEQYTLFSKIVHIFKTCWRIEQNELSLAFDVLARNNQDSKVSFDSLTMEQEQRFDKLLEVMKLLLEESP